MLLHAEPYTVIGPTYTTFRDFDIFELFRPKTNKPKSQTQKQNTLKSKTLIQESHIGN